MTHDLRCVLLSLAALVATQLAAGSVCSAQLLSVAYEASSDDERLFRIDPLTGVATANGAGVAACCGVFPGVSALDPVAGDFFFLGQLSGDNKVFTLDTSSGTVINQPALGTAANYYFLERDSSADDLLVIYQIVLPSAWGLAEVDPVTGVVTPIGPAFGTCCSTNVAGASAIDPAAGRFYFLAKEIAEPEWQLLSVDISTGAITDNPTLATGNNYQFLEIDPESGTLYLVYTTTANSTGHLATVDPSTGILSNVGSDIANCCENPNGSMSALDATGERFFFIGKNIGGSQNQIFSLDLQTGATIASPELSTGVFYNFLEYSSFIFADGFESGDTSAWSSTVGGGGGGG